jgi:hypothetical protein
VPHSATPQLLKLTNAPIRAYDSAVVAENLYFKTPHAQDDKPTSEALSFGDSTGYILNCTFDGGKGLPEVAYINIDGGNTFWKGVLIRSLQAVFEASGMQPF